MYKVFYTEEAKTIIDGLSLKKKRQIKEATERIAQDPAIGKSLRHELASLLSYRSGDYRIIYRVYHGRLIIVILTIGHRKDVYPGFCNSKIRHER